MAHLVTDENGCFVVYGTAPGILVRPSVDEGRKLSFAERLRFMGLPTYLASPGYPASYDAWLFADSKHEVRECEAVLLERREDRAFYVLKVNARNTFNQGEFARFKRARYAMIEPPPPEVGTELTPEEILSPALTFRIRLLNSRGKPISNALVETFAPISSRTKTDAAGYCELRYKSEESGAHFSGLDAYLRVDVPGVVDGPVQCELRTNRLNVIKIKAPATLSGRVVDSEGYPYPVSLGLQYVAFEKFETWYPVRPRPDGSFSFGRLMPHQRFRIVTGDEMVRPTPTWTDDLVLMPREARSGIMIRIRWPGALFGLVVDRNGKPLPGAQLRIQYEAGVVRERSENSDNSGRFGFMGVGDKVFRLRAEASGFLTFISSQIRLNAGELRLVGIRLDRSIAGEQFNPN